MGTKDPTARAANGEHDVVLIYGAQREPEVIEGLLRSGKPALMFVRLHSGPFYPICRTQIDNRVNGDSRRLAEEIRGWHWIVAFGDHLDKVGYAARKAGIDWLAL